MIAYFVGDAFLRQIHPGICVQHFSLAPKFSTVKFGVGCQVAGMNMFHV